MIHDHTLSGEARGRVLGRTCLAFGAILFAYLGLISLVMPGWTPAKLVGLIAASGFTITGLISHSGRFYRICAHVFISLAILTATLASISNGGLTGYVAPFMIISPIAAGYFLSIRSSVVYAIATIAAFGGLLALHDLGFVSDTPYSQDSTRIASLILLSTTMLLGLTCTIGFARAAQRMLREARQAETAKSAFLANMSHEIRTPMNGVLGLLDLALKTPDKRLEREHLEIVHSSARTLVAVLDDVLDFSKLEQGAITITPDAVDVRQVCSDVLDLFRAKTMENGVAMRTEIDPEIAGAVSTDPTRLRQILWNLVGNAVKFTQTGEIILRVKPDTTRPDHLRFAVSDTGIGLSEDARQRIFQRFSQADDSTTRRYGGSGLGLTICRELVDLMDGQIGVESLEQAGSTFWFCVPAPAIAASPTRETASTDGETGTLRVLLVDDQSINRTVASALLQHLGHHVTQAEDGYAAIELAANQPFDIILMDIHMPELDGIEAARQIRRSGGLNAACPIIALTASALDADRQSYLANGMDDCLGKPVQLTDIADMLARHRPAISPPNSKTA